MDTLVLNVELIDTMVRTCNAFKLLPVDKIIDATAGVTQGKRNNTARKSFKPSLTGIKQEATTNNFDEMVINPKKVFL